MSDRIPSYSVMPFIDATHKRQWAMWVGDGIDRDSPRRVTNPKLARVFTEQPTRTDINGVLLEWALARLTGTEPRLW